VVLRPVGQALGAQASRQLVRTPRLSSCESLITPARAAASATRQPAAVFETLTLRRGKQRPISCKTCLGIGHNTCPQCLGRGKTGGLGVALQRCGTCVCGWMPQERSLAVENDRSIQNCQLHSPHQARSATVQLAVVVVRARAPPRGPRPGAPRIRSADSLAAVLHMQASARARDGCAAGGAEVRAFRTTGFSHPRRTAAGALEGSDR